jgi:hypothetical protein
MSVSKTQDISYITLWCKFLHLEMGLYLVLLVLLHYKLGYANCLASLVNLIGSWKRTRWKWMLDPMLLLTLSSNFLLVWRKLRNSRWRSLSTSVKEIEKLKMEMIAMISSWMLQGELQCDHHKSSLIFWKLVWWMSLLPRLFEDSYHGFLCLIIMVMMWFAK